MATNQSNNLRPCPFCGGTNICTEKGINLNYCDSCSAEANIEHWNTRPIEDALRLRIAELEAAQRWIPVSERLPEIGVRVLFYNNFIKNIHKGWFSCDEWVSEIGVFYNGDKLKRITHWMPLPNPPEVK